MTSGMVTAEAQGPISQAEESKTTVEFSWTPDPTWEVFLNDVIRYEQSILGKRLGLIPRWLRTAVTHASGKYLYDTQQMIEQFCKDPWIQNLGYFLLFEHKPSGGYQVCYRVELRGEILARYDLPA